MSDPAAAEDDPPAEEAEEAEEDEEDREWR